MTQPAIHLPGAASLPEYLRTTELGSLSIEDRRLIVEQLLLVLEENYALLPFKVAKYGINPLQRLRLMQARLGRPHDPGPEWRFHAELVDIVNSLRDLHTRYTLPRPFSGAVAQLPFLLKEFTEDGQLRYLVSRIQADQPDIDTDFRFGVEVTHWNGVPMARAIERFAERLPGANPEARHARAVDRFAFRALGFGPPPDEDWVRIRYIDLAGQSRDVELTWDVRSIGPAGGADATELVASDVPLGLDVEGTAVARLRTLLFAPEFIAAEESGTPVAAGPDDVPVDPAMATVFQARRVRADGRTVGHLRIRTFRPVVSGGIGVVGFVREFIRLLGELPQDGLVLDIRGNPGGAIAAAEMCLQALTARALEPEPGQFAATMLNLRICRADDGLVAWRDSMDQALESGAAYSAALALTPPKLLAAVPQSYVGPVVLVTDARCYSAADMFAAGFQDNAIGPILGVDGNTGAGGGNVWFMPDLLEALPAAGVPFQPLPRGAALSVVIRRLLRVGPKAGTPLEDYGVVAKARHPLTRNDVLNNDADLMASAARLLRDRGPHRLDVAVSEDGGALTVTFDAVGIDRADVLVDGRPRVSADLDDRPEPVRMSGVGTPSEVKVMGFDAGRLVAARTFVRKGTTLQPRTTFEA